MTQMTREEFLARYEAGERDFMALNWTEIDLSGTSLHGVQFRSRGTISYVSEWRHVNLRNIEWTECNLTACRFSFCDLRDAKFTDCIIEAMMFKDCNLKRIQVKRSKFFRIVFIRVNFKGANLGHGIHSCGHWFTDCIREDGKFMRGVTVDPWDRLSKTPDF